MTCEDLTMNTTDLKKIVSELLQDTGRLVTQTTDNRAVLLLVRTQVALSLLIDEIEREYGSRAKHT